MLWSVRTLGVAVGGSKFQCGAVCCSVLQRVAVSLAKKPYRVRDDTVVGCHFCPLSGCGIVLQYVAVCCSMLQCVAVCCSVLQWGAVCCSVLQYVAVGCSVLQCVVVLFYPHFKRGMNHSYVCQDSFTL